jgi:hypothetical protein
MDADAKGNISRLVSYLDNFNQELLGGGGSVNELSRISGQIQADIGGNSVMLRDLAQTHTKHAVLDKTQIPGEKVAYKSAIDVNRMDTVIESGVWKNQPVSTDSLFDAYENKKKNINEQPIARKGKFKPLDDEEDEETAFRPGAKGKKSTGNGFYMENNNLKRKK